MITFEEWFMKGIRLGKDFEGDRTFENCSKFFNTTLAKSAWTYQQEIIENLIEGLKFYENTSRLMLTIRDLPKDTFLSAPRITEQHLMDNGDTARELLKIYVKRK